MDAAVGPRHLHPTQGATLLFGPTEWQPLAAGSPLVVCETPASYEPLLGCGSQAPGSGRQLFGSDRQPFGSGLQLPPGAAAQPPSGAVLQPPAGGAVQDLMDMATEQMPAASPASLQHRQRILELAASADGRWGSALSSLEAIHTGLCVQTTALLVVLMQPFNLLILTADHLPWGCRHVAALVAGPEAGRHAVQLWPASAAVAEPQQRRSSPVVLAHCHDAPPSAGGAAQGPWLQILFSRRAKA